MLTNLIFSTHIQKMNMKKTFFLCLALIFVVNLAKAQKYFTRTGNISFYSDAPLEKIEAHNRKATSVLDFENGRMQFAVLIKAFQFEKALMQEHFNENYMESSKFPKSTFKGQIRNITEVDINKNGTYEVKVDGELTIHGVKQNISIDGSIEVNGKSIIGKSSFEVAVADYQIQIPKVVRENIAKTVKITVDLNFERLNKTVAKN